MIGSGKLWKWGRDGTFVSLSLFIVGFWVCGGLVILVDVDVDVDVDGEIFFFLRLSSSSSCEGGEGREGWID